jgi:hypothetical protein
VVHHHAAPPEANLALLTTIAVTVAVAVAVRTARAGANRCRIGRIAEGGRIGSSVCEQRRGRRQGRGRVGRGRVGRGKLEDGVLGALVQARHRVCISEDGVRAGPGRGQPPAWGFKG